MPCLGRPSAAPRNVISKYDAGQLSLSQRPTATEGIALGAAERQRREQRGGESSE